MGLCPATTCLYWGVLSLSRGTARNLCIFCLNKSMLRLFANQSLSRLNLFICTNHTSVGVYCRTLEFSGEG